MTNAEARFNKIHIRKVYACLAVTCHLHFWQNDRDFLRATVVRVNTDINKQSSKTAAGGGDSSVVRAPDS